MSWQLVANLTGETALGRTGSLPLSLRQRLSAAGTLMRVFAEQGDTLWTEERVDPGCLAEVPGLPRPTLVTGPGGAGAEARSLPWMSAPPLAGRSPGSGDAASTAASPSARPEWAGGLLRWPVVAEDVVRRVAHRAFGHALARRLGVGLSDASAVTDLAGFERAVARVPGPWVLKPAWSAAGRGHLFGQGVPGPGDPLRARVGRLLQGQAWGLVEPWLPRALDAGWCGLLAGGRLRAFGSHRLLIDERGRFRGVQLVKGDPRAPGLTDAEHEALVAAAGRAASALALAGYDGPFGIDAMRTVDGRFVPLVELNARATFGLVARVLVERLSLVEPGATATLRFGAGAVPLGTADDPDLRVRVPLLHPDATHRDGGTSAWLDVLG